MRNRFKKVGKPQTLKKIMKPNLESPYLRCGAAGHWVRDYKTPRQRQTSSATLMPAWINIQSN
ncbi:hypothetical protein GIB67_002204, partial [Kingdonia uniflora]